MGDEQQELRGRVAQAEHAGPTQPRVSVATLVKEGQQVPGTELDAQYGNTVYAWNGNHFIVGRRGNILGWYPGAPDAGAPSAPAAGLLGAVPALRPSPTGLAHGPRGLLGG